MFVTRRKLVESGTHKKSERPALAKKKTIRPDLLIVNMYKYKTIFLFANLFNDYSKLPRTYELFRNWNTLNLRKLCRSLRYSSSIWLHEWKLFYLLCETAILLWKLFCSLFTVYVRNLSFTGTTNIPKLSKMALMNLPGKVTDGFMLIWYWYDGFILFWISSTILLVHSKTKYEFHLVAQRGNESGWIWMTGRCRREVWPWTLEEVLVASSPTPPEASCRTAPICLQGRGCRSLSERGTAQLAGATRQSTRQVSKLIIIWQ